MKNKMKNLFQSIAFFSLMIVVGSCSKNTNTADYETVTVRRNNMSSSILATGIIKSKIGAEVRVGSRASGIVKTLYVKNGDEVHKGDLLAKIDDSELSARYQLELANLDNYQTVEKYAKIEMDRAKSLVDKEYTSVQSYDDLVKAYDIARARVASQKASVDFAATQLGFTRIIAPINGVIGSVTTQEGETVAAAFTSPTFVTIIDLSRIEVWTYVDEADIGKVETDQKAVFTVDTYPGITFEGIVTAIYPKAEIRDNVVNYIVIVEISDKKGKILRPEMTTSVTIQTSPANSVLSLPSNAIKRKNGETVVYLLRNGKPVMQKIKTGINGNQTTEVTEGLKENDKVIINSENLVTN
jgi:RND family efflux transporter MFP subunit